MCKIMAFSNSTKLNIKKASETIGSLMLKSERDGFGYAVQGIDSVFGEKCVAQSFKTRFGVGSRVTKNAPQMPIRERYESFGRTTGEFGSGAAIFHGRTSTNIKGLTNCHPMQRDNWHLIHNGVVTDSGPVYTKVTNNDSEDLLYRLIEGIGSVEKHLYGYYAFAAIDPMGQLHIGKDSNALLYVAWSKDLESLIFGTTESLIQDVAKRMKFKIGPIEEVLSDTYTIFNRTGDIIHTQEIKPLGFSQRESRHALASLGHNLNPYSHGRGGEIIDYTGTGRLSEEGWPSFKAEDELDREEKYYEYLEGSE